MTVSLCPHFKIFKKTYIKPREGKGSLISYMLLYQSLRLGNREFEQLCTVNKTVILYFSA